jgi:hypothetical protein
MMGAAARDVRCRIAQASICPFTTPRSESGVDDPHDAPVVRGPWANISRCVRRYWACKSVAERGSGGRRLTLEPSHEVSAERSGVVRGCGGDPDAAVGDDSSLPSGRWTWWSCSDLCDTLSHTVGPATQLPWPPAPVRLATMDDMPTLYRGTRDPAPHSTVGVQISCPRAQLQSPAIPSKH